MGPPSASNSNSIDANNTNASKTGSKDNNDGAAKSLKKTTDSDLKSSVIEFMKVRPFLWNKRHPGYKDHKKRDQEFQEFSDKILYSVQEIKRVWHVLRTNFFRAHKILSDKSHYSGPSNGPSNSNQNGTGGEKVWKYYTAMLYILEGSSLELINTRQPSIGASTSSSRGSISSCSGQVAPTKRENRRVSNRLATNVSKDTNGIVESNNKKMMLMPMNNGTPVTSADTSSANTPTSKLSIFNESLLLDEDDDFLYARSLSLTLRKFDPTTKEVVKLKFQEIIVDYMQQRQQQQQQQQLQLQQRQLQQQQHQQHQQQQQQNHQQPKQELMQLEPPPPSEIANMEASLAVKANDVT